MVGSPPVTCAAEKIAVVYTGDHSEEEPSSSVELIPLVVARSSGSASDQIRSKIEICLYFSPSASVCLADFRGVPLQPSPVQSSPVLAGVLSLSAAAAEQLFGSHSSSSREHTTFSKLALARSQPQIGKTSDHRSAHALCVGAATRRGMKVFKE